MSEEKLTDRLNSLEKNLEEIQEKLNNSKKGKFSLRFKGLLGKRKLRLGYVIVLIINENGAISFAKEPIVDSTIKIGDTFHVVEKDNLLIYKNKPFVIVQKNKLHTFSQQQNEKNETLGQKYILARMQNEAIIPKNKLGAMGGWLFFIVIVIVALYYFFGRGGA